VNERDLSTQAQRTSDIRPAPQVPRPAPQVPRPAPQISLDALKLSAYFGERSRVGHRLLGDELLDLYGSAQIRLSILLRGAQGFGVKHRLRTDRLLTLSEDLPVVAVAVDRPERVQALLDEVRRMVGGSLLTGRGLVTVERARIASSDVSIEDVGHPGSALKLTAYVGRHERVDGQPAFAAVCQLLYERGVDGATVLLGVDGTRHGTRQRARFFARNERVPMMILAVGDGARMLTCVGELQRMLTDGLFTLERVRVCKRDGKLLQTPHHAERIAEQEKRIQTQTQHGDHRDDEPIERPLRHPTWQKLTVVTSEAATHAGRPLHSELVRRLRATRLAGATSLRGMWGFHGDHPPHGDRLLALRRHVPIVTIAIDVPERIAQAFAIVDELTGERGLVTSELVPANMASQRGCSSVG
jgi:PII-like signaling protein